MGLTPAIQPDVRSEANPRAAGAEMTAKSDSDLAREAMAGRFGETVFLADWVEMTFLHFRVEEERLTKWTRFTPDRFEGECYVSLVSFTMNRLRFFRGGALTRWMTLPLSSHRFLNLRTYVRHEGESGILFLSEWLNHRLAVALGPRTFGLPYQLAKIDSKFDPQESEAQVETREDRLGFRAVATEPPRSVSPEPRDYFLLERYSAFTEAGRRPKQFRVWHPSWKVSPTTEVEWEDRSLLEHSGGDLFEDAEFVGGHLTTGLEDVWMGRPHPVQI